jgi:hypothetical protein
LMSEKPIDGCVSRTTHRLSDDFLHDGGVPLGDAFISS